MAEHISINIPGYRIERVLGEGGMAKVYLAVQEGFDRPVALKVISPQLAVDEEFGRRFLREARIVGNLAHTNIVPVYDVGEKDGLYYLSMEILPGGDLKERLAQGISQDAALEITEQVARALKYAQAKGFIHRDVKPDNVLFRDDGTAVLTDFGIARPEDDSSDVTQITQIQAVIGSPKYMSPEQAMGEKLDARTDIYSLGIMLYEMLAGSVPYKGRNITEISLQRAERRSPELPAEFGRLQTLTNKMLAYDRDTRYQNYEELLSDIGKLRNSLNGAEQDDGGEADATVIYTPPSKNDATASSNEPSKLPQILSSVVLVLALVGAGAWYLLNNPSPSPTTPDSATDTAAVPEETTDDISAEQAIVGVEPKEYFAFLDALDASTATTTERFLSDYPDNVLGDILKVRVLGDDSLAEQLRQQAQDNNFSAQLILSELYGNGWGVEKDFQLSKQWASRAAESAQAFPLFQYADLLIDAKENGNEALVSDEEMRRAVSALKNSAGAGFFLAQTQLAYQLLAGNIIDRNVDESIRLLESASQQGDRNASFLLGQILDGGINIDGLPKPDIARAQTYFQKAAQLGHKDAAKFVE